MRRYQLTPEAQQDLLGIADYFSSEAGPSRAASVISELRSAFRGLGQMPGKGHFRLELLDERYRFWRVYSYLVVYRWETRPIQIIAVIHGARDLEAYFTNYPPP